MDWDKWWLIYLFDTVAVVVVKPKPPAIVVLAVSDVDAVLVPNPPNVGATICAAVVVAVAPNDKPKDGALQIKKQPYYRLVLTLKLIIFVFIGNSTNKCLLRSNGVDFMDKNVKPLLENIDWFWFQHFHLIFTVANPIDSSFELFHS